MKSQCAYITISDLIPAHAQEIRRIVEDDGVDSLRAYACKYVPILRRCSLGYVVVDGFHRLAGMVAAGETSLPVVITDADCSDIDCGTPIDDARIIAIYEAARRTDRPRIGRNADRRR